MEITFVLVIQLIVFAVLLGFSGFFSSSETAFFSLNQIQLEQMNRDGNPKVPLIEKLLSKPRQLIVAILIGNEFVNVAASNLSATILLAFLASPDDMWWANIAIMLPLLLLLGEITPKTLAVQNNVAFASFLCRPIDLFSRSVAPLRWIIRHIAEFFTTLLIGKDRGAGSLVTQDMVRTLAKQAADEGAIDSTEHKYIDNIFNFGIQTVGDIMTPRGNIDFVRLNTPINEMLTILRKSHHTRIPVYNLTRDDIVGILHYRDLLKTDINALNSSEDISALLRKPVMVPEGRLVTDLFNTFCQRKLSIALVVDEFGSVTGLITMENMLKSIFGEIGGIHHSAGSTDDVAGIVEEPEPGVFFIDAAMPVASFNRSLSAQLNANGTTTIAGLLLNAYGELPGVGEHIIINKWRFHIEQVAANRITLVKASQVDIEEEEEPVEEQDEQMPLPVHH
ncbi:MAG: HlyC/CorC family transporter [Magnetococcales bacterium]|nr:HlyC/CorC family transporter [Magnetococcales bacterium]